jgi:hypothetical protein
MHRRTPFILAAVLYSVFLTRPSEAQLIGLNHVWTVAGVMDSTSNLVSVFSCTYTGQFTATVGVEIYNENGGYVAGGSTVVAPHGTAVFATRAITGYGLDVELFTGNFPKGHARIMASSSKGVLCNAFLVNAASGLPVLPLNVIKRGAQKGT